MSQMLMSQSGYGGGVSDLIGTMSLNLFFFFILKASLSKITKNNIRKGGKRVCEFKLDIYGLLK